MRNILQKKKTNQKLCLLFNVKSFAGKIQIPVCAPERVKNKKDREVINLAVIPERTTQNFFSY